MKLIKYLTVLIILLFIFACGYLGRNIPFAEQWPLFEALRTTASIIFAVIGAWFAIIYPERLKISFKGGKEKKENSSLGIHKLFAPIVHSTIILSIILLIGIVAPIIKRLSFCHEYLPYFRGFSYALLVFLTLWQLVTVIYSLLPADLIKRSVDSEDATKQSVNNAVTLQQFSEDDYKER